MEAKKKLFFWDLIRYLLLFFVVYRLTSSVVLLENNVGLGIIKVGTEEFLSNDGHIWGDFYWLITGIDWRGSIWFFSMLLIIILDYFWVFRKSVLAEKLRIANWILALFVYASYTLFFPLSPHYDYAIYLYSLSSLGWPLDLSILVLISIAMMWLGVILIDGILIYRSLLEEKNPKAKFIPVLLSLGVPGSGHIACRRYRRGISFILLSPIIWIIGLFSFYIPTVLFWIYTVCDILRIINRSKQSKLSL